MSKIRINSIKIKNYRSFHEEQYFVFPNKDYKKPIAIVGYNNCGKTNLMNAILYTTGYKFVTENTFTKSDIYNLNCNNSISITSDLDASYYPGKDWKGETEMKTIKGEHILTVLNEDNELKSSVKPSFFGTAKHYNIFFINFHNIKDEISTQKTSWGNLKSFLSKHIQKIVENDSKMKAKKAVFESATREATNNVLENSDLSFFISSIKKNFSKNLRNNYCDVDFTLPDYEDIFLQMMFKVGLNCKGKTELVPISNFGDGYISMFVMAVIQAIAEFDTDDKCLFLFEEPESFLHENHQEYFYKMVLCSLAEKEHQVIYTTHSDRMVDMFDTNGIIRLEFDETKKQTEIKFNNTGKFSPNIPRCDEFVEPVSLDRYNSFIKSIEPNLNKILFSRKVVLVEGPNDVMAYKFAIEEQVYALTQDRKRAETYLNFLNIAIIPHHGKATALLLIKLCNWLKLDFFVINDWDLDDDFLKELSNIDTLKELHKSSIYLENGGKLRDSTSKAILTTNFNLIKAAGIDKIHFNIKNLESVLEYGKKDKSSLGIWDRLNKIGSFPPSFFPQHLEEFLEFDKIDENILNIDTIEVPILEMAGY